MRKLMIPLFLLVATVAVAQQPPALKLPRTSPKSVLTQTIGITDVTITYYRPGVKGRTIWGALVPWDKVWRTGANDATTIAFTDDVTINGQKLAAGSYSLHTIPSKDQWTVIFNKDDKQWGSFAYDAAKDALRVMVKPEKADFREWLTFEVPEVSVDSAKVVIRWENVAIPFTVNAGTTEKVMASIKATLATAKPEDWQTPYRAANFAFDNGSSEDAQRWLNQSLSAKQTMAGLWLKARMLAKAGDKAAARTTADAALAMATPEDKDFAGEIRKQMGLWAQ